MDVSHGCGRKQLMKVSICAIGKLGARSEERVLADNYLKRFAQTGRQLGWQFANETEADDVASRFDADFSIMSLELAEFLKALILVFGGMSTD